MELGISTATFFGKAFTEDTFDVIRSLGVGVCEVFMTTFCEYEPEFCDVMLKRKGDLRVHSVHSLNLHYEPELFNISERPRNDANKILRKVLETGRRLGADSYTFHGSARLKSRLYSIDYPKFGNKLNGVVATAAEYGIDLSYENVHWALFNTPAFFENLKAYCPNLKTTLDIKQAMQKGLSYRDFIPVMGDRLNNVHLSDFDADGVMHAPGKGEVDFYDLFTRLFDIGYSGPLMLELYANNYTDYSELGQSIDYLRNILDKIH